MAVGTTLFPIHQVTGGIGMEILVRLIFRAPNYIRCFGVWRGLILLFRVERKLPAFSDKVRRYRVPGYRDPFYLRDSVADHATFRQCLVMQQYDFRRFPQRDRLLRAYRDMVSRQETPLIIDCGANIGLATRWFAEIFPDARIVAVEPDAQNFGMLTLNTESLGDRVVRLRGGIWNSSARLVIANPEAAAAAFQVRELETSADEGMRAYTVAEICEMYGAAAPLIVKLDIEGAQAAVFRSNTAWVENTGLITLELDDWLIPWGGTSRNFFATVSQYPYEYLIRDESVFCFRDFTPETHLKPETEAS